MANIVHRNVGDVMTPYLVTCSAYSSLAEVDEVMNKNKIRRVLVVDDDGKLLGIVTLSDVLEALPSSIERKYSPEELNKLLSSATAESVMTRNPRTVFQTDTLGHAAEIMLEDKIGGIPVLKANGDLAGLITESDIFRAIVRQWRDDNLLFSGAG